jgi:two-component system nitrogen regulation sensor histidine kinase NtrY
MRKRVMYTAGVVVLAILVTAIVWLGSSSLGDFGPQSPEQTYLIWAVSTLIFLLTVVLAFMLVRNFVKLYVERHSNREGSRIRTKLVLGALALSVTPVVFLVVYSYSVLNHNLTKWFSKPASDVNMNYVRIGQAIESESLAKAQAQVDWFASVPDLDKGVLQPLCTDRKVEELFIRAKDGSRVQLCNPPPHQKPEIPKITTAEATIPEGTLVLRTALPIDLAHTQTEINAAVQRYDKLNADRKNTRWAYLQMLSLITLFVVFIATWIALFLAKQISVPISALLGAAQQVRSGNLGYRVRVGANDELASLVRAFNEMTQGLEANSRELENRRRFTEAILESIPTGVLSLTSGGKIQRGNRALKGIFSAELVERATSLEDLFSKEDAVEIRYLMNRARRMGIAASQFELKTAQKMVHLSATVASLDDRVTSGYVLVLEDTSDLLRGQKAAAWHEVARRIAHEIKNPLTPIALCAERIARQLDRGIGPDTARILRECSATISSEVESVKTLVDEFAQFSRFPAAQPVPSDLNEVVESALGVFAGRLDGIEVRKDLDPALPQVNIDREQFKRAVVNLVDNAAEAMQDSLVKGLAIRTTSTSADSVELTIADTGCGISPEDKEKLFLPYFSTKGRGTGLGLAIVNRIIADHNANIRVEDNTPSGARFIVEIATPAAHDTELQPVESRA